MNKTIKTILLIILLGIITIAVAGIVKFNILQDDIIIYEDETPPQTQGIIMSYDLTTGGTINAEFVGENVFVNAENFSDTFTYVEGGEMGFGIYQNIDATRIFVEKDRSIFINDIQSGEVLFEGTLAVDPNASCEETDTCEKNTVDEFANIDVAMNQAALKYLGVTIAEAEKMAQAENHNFRVVSIDGQAQPSTLDFRPGRINAVIGEGIVIDYKLEAGLGDRDSGPETLVLYCSAAENCDEIFPQENTFSTSCTQENEYISDVLGIGSQECCAGLVPVMDGNITAICKNLEAN